MDELRTGLDLATTEELQGLAAILFTRRFNPLDYLIAVDPNDVSSSNRQMWLDRLDRRFRFLAADGITVLRRRSHQVSYHQILAQVCRHLNIAISSTSPTLALEESIFLYVIDLAYQKLPLAEQQSLEKYFYHALTRNQLGQTFIASSRSDALRLMLKGSGAVALSLVVRPLILNQVAKQVAVHIARYQIAQQALLGGRAVLSAAQKQVVLQMARRGIAINMARYSTVRGLLAVIGPTLWMWFLADLGWRAIATNYSRIIPVIFMIAQIRLLRGDG